MAKDAATPTPTETLDRKPIPSDNADGTPRAWSIQVYGPEGEWLGFFETPKTARDWVAKRENAGAHRITQERPVRATSD